MSKIVYFTIGIDPGINGGIAILDDHGEIVTLTKMPETMYDICQTLSVSRARAYIEKVSGYIGGAGHPGSRMFKFGENFGILRAFLFSGKIPTTQVPPSKWQRAIGVSKRSISETKAAYKSRLKARAIELFPKVKITNSTADALLIAYYGFLQIAKEKKT